MSSFRLPTCWNGDLGRARDVQFLWPTRPPSKDGYAVFSILSAPKLFPPNKCVNGGQVSVKSVSKREWSESNEAGALFAVRQEAQALKELGDHPHIISLVDGTAHWAYRLSSSWPG